MGQPPAFSADCAHRHMMPRIQGTQIPSDRSQDAAECFPSRGNHPHDFTKSHSDHGRSPEFR